ncbi:MAG: hypothetical protein GWN48_09095 [Actinobacteria bacterium]|nr:hypothetical protein [Actinomycetota bacterium]
MLLGMVTVLATTCSVTDEPNRAEPTSTTSPSATAATDSTSTTTTVPVSAGLIRIGPASYDLDVTCIAPGAGELLAVGVGRDVNDKPVEAFVQAFLGEPYVGLRVGTGQEEVLFESRLEGVLEFSIADDVLRFPEVDFVTDLDLVSGEFTPAGLGSVVIECRAYEDELPPTMFR